MSVIGVQLVSAADASVSPGYSETDVNILIFFIIFILLRNFYFSLCSLAFEFLSHWDFNKTQAKLSGIY